MSAHELTPWFDGDTKPVRPGVYERTYPTTYCYFALFDGRKWRAYQSTVQLAASRKNRISGFQSLLWRGLAKEPK